MTADEQLRSELRGLRTSKIVDRCSRFRDSAKRPVDERCTRNAMRALARRVQHLEAEIAEHDAAMKTLLDRAAPQLIAEPRCRLRHRRSVLSCLVTSRPLPQRSRVRPTRRDRARRGHLWPEPGPASAQPRRGSPTQPGALLRCRHPTTLLPGHEGLHGSSNQRRQDRTRSHTMPQTLHRTTSLATPRTPRIAP